MGRHVLHAVASLLLFFDSARLREPQDGLFTGQIDAVDTANYSYRVTFDRPGLWIGILKCHDGDDNENVEKVIGWTGKTTTLHVQHAFLYISLSSLHDYNVKMPNFTFCGGRKRATTKFFFLSLNLDMVVRNAASEEFACIILWQSKWVEKIGIEIERTRIHFLADVFVAVAVVVS